MKLHQQDTTFSPIAIVLETREEALRFAEIVDSYQPRPCSEGAYELSCAISNWLSNEVEL